MPWEFLLPLLAALVPVALFFALTRRRPPSRAETTAPDAPRAADAGARTPPADFGLAREAPPAAGKDGAEGQGATNTGAAAAAAAGALLLGYEAAHRGERGEKPDNGPDGNAADRDQR